MSNTNGYAALCQDGKVIKENDNFSCIHCQRIVFIKPGASASDMGGWCMNCGSPVCLKCAGKECDHFMKKIERIENRDKFLRSIGM